MPSQVTVIQSGSIQGSLVPDERSVPVEAEWMRRPGRSSVLVCLVAAVGVLAAVWTIGEIGLYLQARATSKLSNPQRATALLLALPVLAALTVALAIGAWQVFREQTSQRAVVDQWSVTSVALWSLLVWYTLLLHFPIPPLVHHTDKFLILCTVALAWSLWFVIGPKSLARFLSLRPAAWLRLVLVNGLVFVRTGEVVCRLADPVFARSGLFGDKHTPANLKPHMPVRGSIGLTNSQGFKDRERTFERTDHPRLVALGDSFTWGAGVTYDETFVTILERELQRLAPGLEIINLGVPAWGPHEEFHLLKSYGIRFQPEVVLLNFYVGNDIQNKRADDSNLSTILVVAGQSYYVHSNGNWVHDRLGPDRWFLYHNLNYLWRVGTARALKAVEDGGSADRGPGLVPRSLYLKGIHERSDIYLAASSDYFEQHWARTQATLLAMNEFLRARNIRLVVILIPDHVQIDLQLQNEYLAAFRQSRGQYNFEKPQQLLTAWGREHGVPVLDLLPAFKAAGSPESLYFQNDIHWNAAGHALAAQAIRPVLEEVVSSLLMVPRGERR